MHFTTSDAMYIEHSSIKSDEKDLQPSYIASRLNLTPKFSHSVEDTDTLVSAFCTTYMYL